MIRTPTETWYTLSANPGILTVQARAVSISSSANSSFLGKRQRHGNAIVETEFRYAPARNGDRTGLVAFADERHHYFLGLCQTPAGPMLVVALRNGPDDPNDGRIIPATSYTGAPGERTHQSVHGHVDRCLCGASRTPLVTRHTVRISAHQGKIEQGVFAVFVLAGPPSPNFPHQQQHGSARHIRDRLMDGRELGPDGA
jgi:Beta xylosidase C-terminal Concanavalin A-like domain